MGDFPGPPAQTPKKPKWQQRWPKPFFRFFLLVLSPMLRVIVPHGPNAKTMWRRATPTIIATLAWKRWPSSGPRGLIGKSCLQSRRASGCSLCVCTGRRFCPLRWFESVRVLGARVGLALLDNVHAPAGCRRSQGWTIKPPVSESRLQVACQVAGCKLVGLQAAGCWGQDRDGGFTSSSRAGSGHPDVYPVHPEQENFDPPVALKSDRILL